MKDYYKISEISKLYGIGIDSLRYYERLGILNPHRDANGYRLYNLKDMYKLNIIRDLRALGFSMSQIKEYLDSQSVVNTQKLLHRELDLLRLKQEELRMRADTIQKKLTALDTALAVPELTLTVKTMPRRCCVRLNEYITRDEEMDFLIKKLHQKHEDKIRCLETQTICAFLSLPDLKQGISNVYTSVFFVLEQDVPDFDFSLPAGDYLSYYYRGDYRQNDKRLTELLNLAEKENFSIAGEPFEIYAIDNRDTICPGEFLTEIQVLVHT